MLQCHSVYRRRLPVYFLLDISDSMSGDPIEALNQGLQALLTELQDDPMALETVWISCITFADHAKEILPLTEVGRASIPPQSAGGLTRLAKPLRLLLDKLENEVRPNTPQQKGDYKPLIFIIIGGNPIDANEWPQAAAQLHEHVAGRATNLIVLACSPGIQTDILKRITPTVLLMDDQTPDIMRRLFNWVSQSVQATSATSASSEDAADSPALPSGTHIAL